MTSRRWACAAFALSLACDEGPAGPEPEPIPTALAIAEVTFHDITSNGMSADIALESSLASRVDRGFAKQGAESLQITPVMTGVFVAVLPNQPRFRFFRASFRVRGIDPNALQRGREQVKFVPLEAASTISRTPVNKFTRRDGTPASHDLARAMTPTGAMIQDADGALLDLAPGSLATLSPEALAGLPRPDGVMSLFDYAFVVRAFPDAPGDALVVFAFRLPEAATASPDNPTTVSVMFALMTGVVP